MFVTQVRVLWVAMETDARSEGELTDSNGCVGELGSSVSYESFL